MTSPVIVALDYPNLANALELVDQLDPGLCRVKVGKELYTREGPAVLTALHDRGFQVFLDLKFHDIPTTVAKACAVAADMGVWMMNVHASGGARMMEAARQAVEQAGSGSLLIAVTVLTSMSGDEFESIGLSGPVDQHVLRLARLAQGAGLQGVVCSAQEAPMLRAALDPGFLLATPGIRPADAASDDQKRIATPAAAMAMGVNYLVIGRPITQDVYPGKALRAIVERLDGRAE
jgi:orotidine-5'-phosphate decarboxylase